MNTTIPVIRSSEPLCPLDERRAKTELLVKLFVVHFTTIGALFHLLNLRGEYLLSLRPIFYICAPLGFIAQHVIAAAALILSIPLVCVKQRRYPDVRKDLVSPVKWLVARFEVPSTEPDPGLELGQGRASRKWLGESAIRRLGRVLVTTAFLVQCSLSLFLYHRRKAHGPESIGLIDEKIFQLAASGVLIGLLTLATTLRFPGFRLSNPAQGLSTNIEGAMLLLGHRAPPCVRSGVWDAIVVSLTCSFVLSITSCLALHASGSLHPFHDAQCLLNFDKSHNCKVTQGSLLMLPLILSLLATMFLLGLLVTLCFFACCACVAQFSASWAAILLIFFPAGLITMSFVLPDQFGGFFLYVTIYVFFYPFYLITGVVQTLYIGITDYSSIFAQLNEWKDWPVDAACPFLWKDSMADQVWWLA